MPEVDPMPDCGNSVADEPRRGGYRAMLFRFGFLGPLLVLALAAAPASYALAATNCLAGFIERESHPDDRVCVTAAGKARAQAENAVAPLFWTPGPFGPKTCANGLVWREAFQGDFTCVPPSIRTFVGQENALGPSRRAP